MLPGTLVLRKPRRLNEVGLLFCCDYDFLRDLGPHSSPNSGTSCQLA
jgi:hypothetical protein